MQKIESRMKSAQEEAKKMEGVFELQLQQVNIQTEDAKVKVSSLPQIPRPRTRTHHPSLIAQISLFFSFLAEIH